MKTASADTGRIRWWLSAGLVAASQLVGQAAFATLGEDASSVESDRAHMQAQVRTTSVAGYTVHEIQTPNSTIVREYISASGKVFAVSWHGPLLPDFRQTFGRYFDQYLSAASAPRVGHRHLTSRQTDFVLNSNGRMRAFYGTAYVPSLLPTNFSAGDIK